MIDCNRRQFVAASAVGAALAVIGVQDLFAAPGDKAPGAAPAAGPIDVGPLADYSKDAISDKFAKSNKILVIRNGDRIYASSANCTHKGCVLKVNNGQIKCPCHSSSFSEQGTPISGPAKASLTRFGISVNDQGRLIVDRSKQFPERQWDDSGAYVSTAKQTS